MRRTRNKKFINSILPLCAFGVLILVISIVLKIVPDGTDLQSREALLRSMERGQEWSITAETMLEDHLLAEVSSGESDGLALFRPVGDGYTCVAFETAEKGQVVRVYTTVNESKYDCFLLNAGDPARLEILYDNQTEPMKFFCENSGRFWLSAPDGEYTIRITYYDAQENVVGTYHG